jgi:hypothetical protein
MHINDSGVRDHLKQNFDKRTAWMDNFVEHVDKNDLHYHENAFDDLPGVRISNMYKPRPEKVDKIVGKLPAGHREAFDAVSDWLHSKKKANWQDFETVKETLNKKLESASSDELWSLYMHGLQSPKYQKKSWNDWRDYYSPAILVPKFVQNHADDEGKQRFLSKLKTMEPHQKAQSNSDYWENIFHGILESKEAA